MPELNSQNIEHRALEADIERLSKEIIEKRKLPEYKELSEKELLRQTLQPLIKQQTFQQGGRPPAVQSTAPVRETILPDYLKDSPAELKIQVEKLIDLVFHQGIRKTAKQARQAGAFILDAFHDALTDKLYDELKKRKLL